MPNKVQVSIRTILSSFIFLFAYLYCATVSFAQTSSEIKITDGIPSLLIDGKTYPPYAYMSYLGEKEYYKEIAENGIHLYNIPSYLGDRGINSESGIGIFRKPIWISENEFDFSSIITDFEKIVQSDSEAKVIIRFYLDPPLWWEKLNPDACCQLPDGSTFRQCFSSQKWRNETGKAFQHCIDWLLKSKYSDYLAGIHVASGFTEEWFYHPKQYHDENPAREEAFQRWLKNKYQKTNSLRKAWNNESVTFETAPLANIDEKKNRKEWRDINYEQYYFDTFQFHTETMVDNISYFCKIVKERSNGNLLTGAFYGYHYFVGDPRRGHGALAKLLECPHLDYLSSPNVYNRVIGEDWAPMAAVKSVQLHGKLWLAENDTRTSITTLLKDRSQGIAPPGQYESGVWLGPEDIETSVAFLWKNSARMLTHGYGGWWFDMWGGWFSNPKLLFVLNKTQQLHQQFKPNKPEKMHAQVCVFVDEKLSFWDASYGSLTNKILSNQFSLAKTGAPHDLYLLTDVDSISARQYKVIWLMGITELSKKEFATIENWKKQGVTVLWTDRNNTTIIDKNKQNYLFEAKVKWTATELRKQWQNAGVHIYIPENDVFYIGNNWLSIHTIDGGARKINLPFYAKVFDPIDNRLLKDSTKTFEIDIDPKSTVLLRIDPL